MYDGMSFYMDNFNKDIANLFNICKWLLDFCNEISK